MENIQNTQSINVGYNPLKDASFWVAFVMGGGPVLLMLIGSGFAVQTPIIINLVFLVAWVGWIIFKKGKKGSFLGGFIIAVVAAGISFIPVMKIEENRREKELNKAMETLRQQMQLESKKNIQQQAR
ncbi:MAG: hypothetical protein WC817_00010 [Patescibacteria group bacterium]|jgi:hypothetical protein